MAAAKADATVSAVRLVVGLGNPGREYENTRHNVGFLVLNRLVRRQRLDWTFSSSWQAQWCRMASGNFFLKPLTYMNLSGRSVRAFSQFYKLGVEQTLIVYDDLALPLGQLRLRREGSSGGQNGMQSVIEHLGTSAVARLRVGIGGVKDRRSMVDHVLSEFAGSERETLDAALERAADAVEHACLHGVESTMNAFNRSPA